MNCPIFGLSDDIAILVALMWFWDLKLGCAKYLDILLGWSAVELGVLNLDGDFDYIGCWILSYESGIISFDKLEPS